MVAAVVFDMDGLLIDNDHLWVEAEKNLLAKLGFTVSTEYVQSHAGLRTIDEVKLWRSDFGLSEELDDEVLAEDLEHYVKQLVQAKGEPLPGVIDLVKELAFREVPMAVASSSSGMLIRATVEKLGIISYMRALHSGVDERKGKPFPDVFLSAARSLATDPEDCVVFEDSLNGIRAAKAAGMKCIAVPQKPYDRSVFDAEQPDLIVDSLEVVTWEMLKEL